MLQVTKNLVLLLFSIHLWLSLMHFVSERLIFFFLLSLNFRFQLPSFGLGNSTNQCRPPFASLAALHTRLLSYHPDACFLFLLSLPYHISLHISFPESNQRPACQIPANWEPGVVTFWQNFKVFFPYFTFPFNYTSTCVAVRILFNLAQEYWSSAQSLVILKIPPL